MPALPGVPGRLVSPPPKPPGSPSVSHSAATQIAPGALAGENVLAFAAELPAATQQTTPAFTQFVTAWFSGAKTTAAPRLMLHTLTWLAFWVTKSMAA